MAKTRKKMTEEEKKQKRREQKKFSMRKARLKLKMDPIALEEKRRKDREYYHKKKEKGQIKKIEEFTPRQQRLIRKKWREDAKKRREVKKMQKRTEEIIAHDTPPSSPRSSVSREIARDSNVNSKRKLRRAIAENKRLKSRLLEIESKLAKYRMRCYRNRAVPITRRASTEEKQRKERIIKHKKAVHEFLLDDEHSRLTSGKKETITRGKQKQQIRLLNDSLLNLHRVFKHKTGLTISYKTFCRYRPFWVLIPKAASRNTCLCATHENMRFIIKALQIARVIKENSPSTLVKTMCCDVPKESCYERTCPDCHKLSININEHDGKDQIRYERWITKSVITNVKGQNIAKKKTMKETVLTTKHNLISLLKNSLPKFMSHVNNIAHQLKEVRKLKETMTAYDCLLHIDFSENYMTKYSTEVQSTHFGGSKVQLTLHTGVVYYLDTDPSNEFNTIKNESFCTITENLKHDPILICAHLKPIIEYIKTQVPALQNMHFLSDGPSTQYRNKTMFHLIATYIKTELGVANIFWHYSEAGHGKGAPDGVGGCIKRVADMQVALGRDITDVSSLVECLKENCKGIKVIQVDDSEINSINYYLANCTIQPFKGTMKIHQLAWNQKSPNVLQARRLSCSVCTADMNCPHYGLGQISIPIPRQSPILSDTTDDDLNNFHYMASMLSRRKRTRLQIYSSSDSEDGFQNQIPVNAVVTPVKTHDYENNNGGSLINNKFPWSSDDESIFGMSK